MWIVDVCVIEKQFVICILPQSAASKGWKNEQIAWEDRAQKLI